MIATAVVALSSAWLTKNSIASCELRIPVGSSASYVMVTKFIRDLNGEKETAYELKDEMRMLFLDKSNDVVNVKAMLTRSYIENGQVVHTDSGENTMSQPTFGILGLGKSYYKIEEDTSEFELCEISPWRPKYVFGPGQFIVRQVMFPAELLAQVRRYNSENGTEYFTDFKAIPSFARFSVISVSESSVNVRSEVEGSVTYKYSGDPTVYTSKRVIDVSYRRSDGLMESMKDNETTTVKDSEGLYTAVESKEIDLVEYLPPK